MFKQWIFLARCKMQNGAFWANIVLTLEVPFMTIVATVGSVDQDQAAQIVQPDP